MYRKLPKPIHVPVAMILIAIPEPSYKIMLECNALIILIFLKTYRIVIPVVAGSIPVVHPN